MADIALLGGEIAQVDDSDVCCLGGFVWRAGRDYRHPGKPIRHVIASIPGGYVLLHRHLTQCPNGLVVDHIDGDPLNNRRSNLRICSRYDNHLNRVKYRNNQSGYKGVYLDARVVERGGGKPWRAQISINHRRTCLGNFSTPEEAFDAYCRASERLHGDYGRVA